MRHQVDSTQIKAGIDGTVLSVFLTEGSPVEAYKSVIVVADVDHLEASADLLDKDLQVLTEGMDVMVAPVSSPGKAAPGLIRKMPYPYGAIRTANRKIVHLGHPRGFSRIWA
jgi:multidrug resistance efflux pump